MIIINWSLWDTADRNRTESKFILFVAVKVQLPSPLTPWDSHMVYWGVCLENRDALYYIVFSHLSLSLLDEVIRDQWNRQLWWFWVTVKFNSIECIDTLSHVRRSNDRMRSFVYRVTKAETYVAVKEKRHNVLLILTNIQVKKSLKHINSFLYINFSINSNSSCRNRIHKPWKSTAITFTNGNIGKYLKSNVLQ